MCCSDMYRKYFLFMAEKLIGIPKEQIKVVYFTVNKDGLYSGIIEVDGSREYIHEFHN
jgi:hypothetical protein